MSGGAAQHRSVGKEKPSGNCTQGNSTVNATKTVPGPGSSVRMPSGKSG